MRTVYATQFRVMSSRGVTTGELVKNLVDHAWLWISERYKFSPAHAAVAFDGQPHELQPGHQVVARREAVDDHVLVTLSWSFPHDPDPAMRWLVELSIAASAGKVETAIVVRIGSVGFVIRPVEYDLRRPKVVAAMLRAFSCFAGTTRLSPAPTMLDVRDVKPFVAEVLEEPGRAVPVVMISPDVWTDRPCVDAGVIHDTLAGLALVAQLKTKWAAFELTEAVGRDRSCYNGAARLYWPRLPSGRPSADDRIYLANFIQSTGKRGRPFNTYLFRSLAAIAAFRFTEGEVIGRVKDAIEVHRRAHFDALVERARTASAGPDHELLEFALDENKRLAEEARGAGDRIRELERELEAYKENLAEIYRYKQPADETNIGMEDAERSQVDTVLGALERVAERCTDILVIYKSAKESAAASDFARPEEILKALLSIAEVGGEYFASKGKRSMGPWDAAFAAHGLKYAPTDSQNTINMYGEERKFTHDGVRKQMLKHLTVGKGDTKNCVQIYFEPNDQTHRIEIGYCGRHLSYYGQ